MGYALWQAMRNAVADGREPGARFTTLAGRPASPRPGDNSEAAPPQAPLPLPMQRAAFVMVVMAATHSLLEYPLWYSYFLLPAAFAFGLCLERPDPRDQALAAADRGTVTRPLVLAPMLLILATTLALYDYMRVVDHLRAAGATPRRSSKRIADGRRSILFAHHADYAAATVVEHPSTVMKAFQRAPHFLLDARLMLAWAKALDEAGETDKARFVAARLKEFRNDQAAEFFAPCAAASASAADRRPCGRPAAAASAPARPGSAPAALPFQCLGAGQAGQLPRLQIHAPAPASPGSAASRPTCRRASRAGARRRSPCRGRPPCTCRRPSAGRPAPRSAPPSRRRCGRASRPGRCSAARWRRASTSNSTAMRVIAIGWQSGTSSEVRLAPWIAATRATPRTSPFVAPPDSISVSVSGRIRIAPPARATRCVSAFADDVDHVRLAVGVEVGQLAHRRRSRGPKRKGKRFRCTTARCAAGGRPRPASGSPRRAASSSGVVDPGLARADHPRGRRTSRA